MQPSKKLFCVVLFCGFTIALFGQNVLHKPISIQAKQESTIMVLSKIERQVNIIFSYPSNLVSKDKLVSIDIKNERLENVLNEILGNQVKFIQRGSYIIIQPKRSTSSSKVNMQFSGKIIDANSGDRIANATIYNVNSLKSTNTNKNGKYDLSIKEKSDYVEIAIAKENYQDTILRLHRYDTIPWTIELKPITEIKPGMQTSSTTDSLKVVQMLVKKEALFNMNNVWLHEKRFFQVSFLPILGTNKMLSGKTGNNLSVNIIAGYAFALEGFEFGSVMNIIRQNMNGLQVAGVANIVGGHSQGIQVAGVTSITKLNTTGFQGAGFVSTTTGELKGIQASGFLNFATQAKGLQAAGFVNTAWSKSNVHQFAGFANMCHTNTGTQWAGGINLSAAQLNGIQFAGLVNHASSVNGLQFALIANSATGSCKGVQLTPLLNFAGKLNGLQLGLLNFCDTVESGVNVGLLSFVKRGIHKLQFHNSDGLPMNVIFKTGSNAFYNIVALGYQPDFIWSFGYGIGSLHQYKNGIFAGCELQVNSVQKEGRFFQSVNVLHQLHPFFGFRFSKSFGISLGPEFNLYYVKQNDMGFEFTDYNVLPFAFYNKTSGNANVQMSWGLRLGVMFF